MNSTLPPKRNNATPTHNDVRQSIKSVETMIPLVEKLYADRKKFELEMGESVEDAIRTLSQRVDELAESIKQSNVTKNVTVASPVQTKEHPKEQTKDLDNEGPKNSSEKKEEVASKPATRSRRQRRS